jgi:hypothetical protein
MGQFPEKNTSPKASKPLEPGNPRGIGFAHPSPAQRPMVNDWTS